MKQADRDLLQGFNELPDCAMVRMPVVAALFNISPATVWRWRKRGLLPSPTRLGGLALWRVSDLRAAKTSPQATAAATAPPGAHADDDGAS